MPLFNVKIKHSGKTHDVVLDTDQPGLAFKEAIFQKTGIPVDRMKVMVKGGMLKDDGDWKKIAPKEGQAFTVIGAAGELPKPPSEPVKFLEDMDDAELANALRLPVGLVNLGNTCYMSATIQAMRGIPELQNALNIAKPFAPLPKAFNELFNTMANTTGSVTPSNFLVNLRQVVPQFNERARQGLGFAQQDAEECWSQILQAVKDIPGSPGPSGVVDSNRKFVDQYMTGRIVREMKSAEAPDEPPSITTENVLKVECNINMNTNFMHSGIADALDQTIVKRSESLGREATYTMQSRLSRLPTYLTVHMVRFTWRRDINKKAKIMRKVKFPVEYDALDLATDELKGKLRPVSRRLLEIEKERRERTKVRRRTKAAKEAAAAPTPAPVSGGDEPMEVVSEGTQGGALKDEDEYRREELAELEKLVDPEVKADVGASVTGLYDLVAIITHKGAAADAGHYIGFVKKSALHSPKPTGIVDGGDSSTGSGAGVVADDDDDWYKFDDEKVSIFPAEKLATLDGGGEDASAYVLLYRSKTLV
ncbi:cysteine proteinase [Amylostereum chailletii]|nr:cysteine proteinase [Amylostereum chailletii]